MKRAFPKYEGLPLFFARNRHAIGAVAHIRRYISGLIYLSGYFLGCAHMKLDQYQKVIEAFQYIAFVIKG